MLNQIVLQGRLTKDPDYRMTQNQKPVSSFTLAVDRDYQQSGEDRETDFINCVSFGKTADFIHSYFFKGQMAIVVGRLQLRNWTDKDNNKRISAEVVVDRTYFAGDKKSSGQSQAGFTELNDSDGELPF